MVKTLLKNVDDLVPAEKHLEHDDY